MKETTQRAHMSGTKAENKNRLRWLGILWVLLGVVAITTAFAATLATMLVFGVFLLVAGIAQLVHATGQASTDRGWELLTSAIYGTVGLLLIFDPVSGAIGLTLLIALLFLVRGIIQLAMTAAGRHRRRSSGWRVAAGLINLLFAIFLIAGWPQVGIWIIGVLVGIELLIGGLVMLLTPEVVASQELL